MEAEMEQERRQEPSGPVEIPSSELCSSEGEYRSPTPQREAEEREQSRPPPLRVMPEALSHRIRVFHDGSSTSSRSSSQQSR